jgi:protein ImuA
MKFLKADIMKHLHSDILRMQGFASPVNGSKDFGLGIINEAFPSQSFPLGAIHEFVSPQSEDAASACGFIAGMLSSLTKTNGAVAWVSASRTLFPPALKTFDIAPDRFIFIDLQKEKDILWAMEEALKCNALAAVVGEMKNLDFTASRRLQLAVEKSQVTGFILRNNYKQLNTTACVSRWRITSLPSVATDDDLPGVGFPRWKIELLRMRNGKTGVWEIQWIDGRFVVSLPFVNKPVLNLTWMEKQAG